MSETKIEWTDSTWNPVAGCTRVSAGCDNCYAVVQTRIKAGNSKMKGKYVGLVNPGKNHFNGIARLWEPHLEVPLRDKRPRRYFVNSMSDLFHEELTSDEIARVFDVMARAHWHVFQVLTKRPERAAELASSLPWPPNILMGTSVEDDRVLGRIDALRAIPAAVRFLSCEPLIGPLGRVDLSGIHWCIAGGESGRGARPMKPEWAQEIRDQCVEQGVAFHFKQWGQFDAAGVSVGKKKAGRELDGQEWNQHPAVAGYAAKGTIGLATPPPLTDAEFDRIAHLLPGHAAAAGGRGRDNRAFLDAVRWKAYTLKPWRDLPADHVKWNSLAVRVKRWHRDGKWPAVLGELGDPILARFIATYGGRR